MRIRTGNRKGVLLFTVMTLIVGLIALRPALTSRAVASAQSGWKEDALSQMIELEATIVRLKRQLAASPKDATLKEQLEAALNTYDQLSARMGGDRAPITAKGGSVSALNAPVGGVGGVIPPAATGCVLTTTVTTQSTPAAIPTGPAVVTSTVAVAGAGPVVWDVNLQTFIRHTFSADLDITLMSPAGTVVTLTSDNGAGNDDVFNGTIWDDDANPAGQVPYTNNNGLVTDHAYANLTLASPLVPEEAMAAFRGENPNGTWTITISDDLAGDGGSLDSWSIEITTLPAAPVTAITSVTQATPIAIPTGPAVVTSTVVVGSAGTTIHNVRLTTNLTHTFAADLDITLMSPAGTVVTLTSDNGAGNDNVFNGTLWDDDANPAGQVPYTNNNGLATDHAYVNLTPATPLVPEEAMGAFIGENPNGTWTITISDDLPGDGGSLDSWTLEITTSTCGQPCMLTCPANITQSNDPNQCGAVVTYPAPTTTGTCGTITCSPASGSFFPKGTTTVTCSNTGGTPSCTFTITVVDNQAPTITCPANISTGTDPDQCGALVTFPLPTVADNCPGVGTPMITRGLPSGALFPVGTTTNTFRVSDASGNTATCSFTVTVQDTQPPSITCPANQTAVSDQNVCPSPACTVVTYPAPVATDNCFDARVVCNPPAGSCFPTGVTTVTCTATDGSGNTATCSFPVTVFDVALQDDSDPSIILLWNSITGQYRFCCRGVTYTGAGKSTIQGCVYTLQHNPADKRVLGRVDKAVHAGTGSIQAPAGTIRCTITDRNTLNDTNLAACQ